MSSKNRYFTLDDLALEFDRATLIRGIDYATDKKVIGWSFDEDFIESEVQGSGRKVYTQEIELAFVDKKLAAVNGSCSCPVGYNCKHVAAVLINILDYWQQNPRVQQTAKTVLSFNEQKWLNDLAFTPRDHTFPMPGTSRQSKADPGFLIFTVSTLTNSQEVRLLPGKAKLNAKGELKYSKLPLNTRELLSNTDMLTEEDLELLALFNMSTMNSYYYSYYLPKDKIGAKILGRIAKADKLYWLKTENKQSLLQKLTYQDNVPAQLHWQEKQGLLRLRWQLAGTDTDAPYYLLPTDPPWVITTDQCGRLYVGATGDYRLPDLLNLVSQAPAISAVEQKKRQEFAHRLLELNLQNVIPLPAELAQTQRDDVSMTPVLMLGSMSNPEIGWLETDFAELNYSYEGMLVSADMDAAVLSRRNNDGVEHIVRNQQAEQHALQTLLELGFDMVKAADGGSSNFYVLGDQNAWLRFTTSKLPVLREQGWNIEFLDGYRYDLQEVEDWYAEVAEEQQQSPWFDLELGIIVNQTKISLLPLLVSLIRQTPQNFSLQQLTQRADDEQVLLELPDLSRVALPYGRIKPILMILGELYFNEELGDSLRLPTLDAARLAELAATTQLRWIGGERLQAFGQRLAEFGGIQSVTPPLGLQASLRDYQKEGLAWMQFLREYQLAGILADDMGLGKTIQTLSHILLEKEAGRLTQPALVIAPTSLMDNWASEARRFTPDLRVLVLHGKDRGKLFEQIPQADLVLTTYALLPRDETALRQHHYHLLILDEAQYIKNAQAKASQTASMLQANHRLCLTGTPLQNHLGELWSQFNFLMPGLLGDLKTFNKDFRQPIEKLGDSQRHALLTRRIKPFLLRRTKDKVAKELPAKTEIVRHIELAGAQRDLYETVRLAMDEKVRVEIAKKGVARSQIVILDALLKLRQVCCDPRLVKITGVKTSKAKMPPSAKLAELLDMLDELLEEGRKVLVFSQFTSMLELIAEALDEKKYRYALLTGDTDNRGEVVRSFQEGDIPIFLISLKAGGVGLNLTAADTVIHYDPWWNPAAENQATDRAWRIGQDKPVFVYRLIAKGTLEEKIQEMQAQKAELARAILDQGEIGTAQLTVEDLRDIFAPLDHLQEA